MAAIVKPPQDEEKKDQKPERTRTDVSHLKGKKGVPDFWSRAIKTDDDIWNHVNKKDAPIMEHLLNVESEITVVESNRNEVLTLKMQFAEDNDYFRPSTLICAVEYEGEDRVKEMRGTPIQWLNNKDPTKKHIKAKYKHKHTGNIKTVEKIVDNKSFFDIFRDRQTPSDNDSSDDEEVNEKKNKQREEMDEVKEIVEEFHDYFIPYALDYYLGFNDDYDSDDDSDDDSDSNDSSKSEDDKAKKKGNKPK